MGDIIDKLNYLLSTKTQVDEALMAKGQSVSASDTFRSYADKIRAINNASGGASGGTSSAEMALCELGAVDNLCDMIPHTGYFTSYECEELSMSSHIRSASACTNRSLAEIYDFIDDWDKRYYALPVYDSTISCSIESPIGTLVIAVFGSEWGCTYVPDGWTQLSKDAYDITSVQDVVTVFYKFATTEVTTITLNIANKLGSQTDADSANINMHVFNTSDAPFIFLRKHRLATTNHFPHPDYATDCTVTKCDGVVLFAAKLAEPLFGYVQGAPEGETVGTQPCNHKYDDYWRCTDNNVYIEQSKEKHYRYWLDHGYGPSTGYASDEEYDKVLDCPWSYTMPLLGTIVDTRMAIASYDIHYRPSCATGTGDVDMYMLVGVSIPITPVAYVPDESSYATHWYSAPDTVANYVVRVQPSTRYLLYVKKPGNRLSVTAWTGDPTSTHEVVRGDARMLYETTSPKEGFMYSIMTSDKERYINIYYSSQNEDAIIYLYPLNDIDNGILSGVAGRSHVAWTGGSY